MGITGLSQTAGHHLYVKVQIIDSLDIEDKTL